MKRNDFILIGVLLLMGLLIILLITLTKTEGSKVLITIDGKEFKTMKLDEDTTYKVETENGEWNTFVIKDGYVDMIDASCPDKICVDSNEIHYNSETIVCLPNKVILEVTGGEESELDAVAN